MYFVESKAMRASMPGRELALDLLHLLADALR